jgi:hypothetical protein
MSMKKNSALLGLVLGTVALVMTTAGVAVAQDITWSPPCGVATIVNSTECYVAIEVVTEPYNAIGTHHLPPFGADAVILPRGTTVIVKGIRVGGSVLPFNPPPAPASMNCSGYWLQHIDLGEGGPCCTDICADRDNGCVIDIRPCQ